MMGLYLFVFGTIFGGSYHALPNETKLDYAFGLFLSLDVLRRAGRDHRDRPHPNRHQPEPGEKGGLPLEILPLSQLGTSWFNFLDQPFPPADRRPDLRPRPGPARPALAAGHHHPHLLLTIGLGWFRPRVFFRDVQHVVQFASQVILYASAVFFSPSLMPPHSWYWLILRWNPFLHTVDLARNALLWGLPVSPTGLLYTYLAGAAAFVFGLWFFRKMQPAFADVI